MVISSKCKYCHCFGTHQLTYNLKANIFILKVKKTYIGAFNASFCMTIFDDVLF